MVHVRILLKADENEGGPAWKDDHIKEALDVSISTIERVRRKFVEEGTDVAVSRKAGSGYRDRKIDGEKEAHLLALACTRPPEGQVKWTLRLLAEKMVELQYIDAISYETVRRALKKRNQTLAKEAMVHSSGRTPLNGG